MFWLLIRDWHNASTLLILSGFESLKVAGCELSCGDICSSSEQMAV